MKSACNQAERDAEKRLKKYCRPANPRKGQGPTDAPVTATDGLYASSG